MSIDPVTFELVWHRLLDATEEMGIKYMRTSGSPVLVGAYDASTGITLPDGELVAMGPYITTQAHVLRLIVESVLRTRSQRPGIGVDDMFICNDPYLGATHQPDVATVAPVHYGGELRAWVGASGHWLDIGGPEPGGFNMNATSVFDEGLRMPPTRIVEGGVVREDLVELIMTQIREPLAALDLRGQIVANQAGKERLAALFDEFGPTTVEQVMRGGIDHVERRLRARLRSLPDGVWREAQFLDHDGHQSHLRKIVCTLTKQGERLRIDFTGSDPQTGGFANCAYGGLRAAALSAICILLGYDLPWNDGVARCMELVGPPRTVVTAEYPTPVSMSTISAVIVTLNLVLATLSKVLLASPRHHEEAMASWCGTSLGVSIIGVNDRGQLTVCPEASHFAAGCGARTYADGVDTGGIIINTTANIPSVEATEAEYPLLYLFRRQLLDSGGAGRFRGGVSAGVALMPYGVQAAELETSFSGVGAETPNAVGLAGGLPGASARYLCYLNAEIPARLARGEPLPGDLDDLPGELLVTPINRSHAPFPKSSVEYHNWQGGGGYGDPLDRAPERVRADVLANLVSPAMAARLYGVVLRDGAVDEAATARLRDQERAERRRRGRPASELFTGEEPLALPPTPGRAEDARSAHAIDEPPPGAGLAAGTPARRLRYGDVVEFDFGTDVARCLRCQRSLGDARSDFRLGCLVEEGPTSTAGPVRGEDYAVHLVILRRYYCPGCGRQLESEVTAASAPRSSFRLAGGAA
jgi:N-methylhydantoinase B